MVISVDTESTGQNPTLFMIKAFNKLGIKGNFLNLIKGVYEKPAANVTLDRQGLNPSRWDQEQHR